MKILKITVLASFLFVRSVSGQNLSVTGQLVVQSSPLTINPTVAFSQIYQNIPFNASPTISGGQSPYTCVWTGTFPTGLSANGCGVMGTPTGSTSQTMTLKATDTLNQSTTIQIVMKPATLSSTSVAPAAGGSLTVAIGATQQLVATGTWSNSSTLAITSNCTWSSGTPGTATISSAGLVTGVANGTSVMTCAFNSVNGTATVTVPAAAPALATTSIPTAQNGIAYPPFTLTCSGGTAPYTFAISAGALPVGLSLSASGVISGTTTAASTTPSFTCTDSFPHTSAAVALAVTVATVSSNAVTLSPATVTVGSTSQGKSTTTFASPAGTANTTAGSALSVKPQVAKASDGTGTTLGSLQTNGVPVVVGDTIVCVGRHGTDFTSSVTCTDTAVNTFTKIGSLTANSPNLGAAQMSYAKVTVANTADNLTCTYGASVAYDSCLGIIIAGADTSTPLDTHNENTATSGSNGLTSATSGALTTTSANEVLVQWGSESSLNAVYSAGSNYTLNVSDADGMAGMQSSVVSTTQTGVTPSINFSIGSAATISLVGTFKAAAAGGAAWSSASPLIASVNGNGLVTCLAIGTSSISAVFGGQTGSATVTCQGGPVTSITISPTSFTGANGATQPLSAFDQAGNNITNAVVWASSNLPCATVSASGLLQIVSASVCSATGTATSGSVSASIPISGTGTVTSILSGYTVNAANAISGAVPAGWTLVTAEGFEGGSCSSNALCSGSVLTTRAHTGTRSFGGTLSGSEQNVSWTLNAGVINSRHWYLSFWEYADCPPVMSGGVSYGCLADEMFLARPYIQGAGGSLTMEVIFDWFQANGLSSAAGNTGFEALNGVEVMEPQENVAPNFSATYQGLQTQVGFGAGWQQWEIEFNPGAPSANNCLATVWRNGNKESSFGPINCISGEDFTNQLLQVGGQYTYTIWLESGGGCSSHIGGDAGGAANNGRYLDFTVTDSCSGQAPPTGKGHIWTRYFDDIIVLKK